MTGKIESYVQLCLLKRTFVLGCATIPRMNINDDKNNGRDYMKVVCSLLLFWCMCRFSMLVSVLPLCVVFLCWFSVLVVCVGFRCWFSLLPLCAVFFYISVLCWCMCWF